MRILFHGGSVAPNTLVTSVCSALDKKRDVRLSRINSPFVKRISYSHLMWFENERCCRFEPFIVLPDVAVLTPLTPGIFPLVESPSRGVLGDAMGFTFAMRFNS